jgi:branched-chain amino acid aminotransferase
MIEKEKWIWMDGKFVEWDEAKVHVLCHTLHYGYGAFEGIRAYKQDKGGSAVFRLKEHIQRLLGSAKLLELECPFSMEAVMDACVATLKINRLQEGYIRPLLYLGEREVGVYPGDSPDVHLAIITWKWGSYLGAGAHENGIRAKISTFNKFHVNSVLLKGKVVGHYVNSVLAKMEAKREGYAEAILLDHEGYVAEGSGENIFIVKGGEIITPGDDASILGGITRDSVITIAKDNGFPVVFRRLTRNDLYLANEVFFTGTAAEITPIVEIDRRVIGSGKPGAITRELQQAFREVTRGRSTRYPHWLTYYTIEEDVASTMASTQVTEA